MKPENNSEVTTWNRRFLNYLTQSVTPFHAVDEARKIFISNGFTELFETARWILEPKKKYFVVREGSVIAFQYSSQLIKTGWRMIGTHSDSPCLKLRPNSIFSTHNYLRLGCEVYGGVILSTWFDRSLGIAGKLITENQGKLSDSLVKTNSAVATLPNLAIHLNRDVNENRTIQKQHELIPLLGQQFENGSKNILETLFSDQLKKSGKYLASDLSLFDTQPAAVIGMHDEFIVSARLDNLLSTYAAIAAITESDSAEAKMIVISDHEEVGSASASGAAGAFLKQVLSRITNNVEELAMILAQSILISADNAHGIHPNYPERHDSQHAPILNQGPVVKINHSQRYATQAKTAAAFIQLCQEEKIPHQVFVSRNDIACGSTIGPITASELGIATVDVGAPTFAMHSIRETAGAMDAWYLFRVFRRFFS